MPGLRRVVLAAVVVAEAAVGVEVAFVVRVVRLGRVVSVGPIRSGDPVAATAWLEEDAAVLEGDDVKVHAELSDVDEVAIVVASEDERHDVLIHLSRVQAIALAGQIAWAATANQAELPHGHGAGGFYS